MFAHRERYLLGGALIVLLGLTACTGSGRPAGTTDHSTAATSPTSPAGGLAGDGQAGSPTTSPASSARPVPTGPVTVGAITETVASSCPYLDTGTASDAEGNKIGVVSVLSVRGRTMGCRFRFQFGDNHYALEITSTRYATSTAAYNAMVHLGSSSSQTIGVPGLAPHVDGVLYRTRFYPPDGASDWACSFAKNTTVVTVKTDQNDTSHDAENLAKLLVGKF